MMKQLKRKARINRLNLRYIKANKEDKQEMSMIKIIMIREIIKIDIGQIVEIGKYHSLVEYNMDRITETDQRYFRRGNFVRKFAILESEL